MLEASVAAVPEHELPQPGKLYFSLRVRSSVLTQWRVPSRMLEASVAAVPELELPQPGKLSSQAISPREPEGAEQGELDATVATVTGSEHPVEANQTVLARAKAHPLKIQYRFTGGSLVLTLKFFQRFFSRAGQREPTGAGCQHQLGPPPLQPQGTPFPCSSPSWRVRRSEGAGGSESVRTRERAALLGEVPATRSQPFSASLRVRSSELAQWRVPSRML